MPLSGAAQALLKQLPKLGNGGWVFSTSGATSISGFSKFKTKMDELVLEKLRKHDPEAKPLPTWTTHDLRRTARSLMSRASVAPDHAERALGHVIGGIRETYDRHEYVEEKRQAFEALAAQLERIINPKENVVQLRTATTS